MGLINWYVHKQKKKFFRNFIGVLKTMPAEEKASMLVLAYTYSGLPTVPTEEFKQRAIARGYDPKFIEFMSRKIVHYHPANQTPILDYKEEAERTGDVAQTLALTIHDFTNMATAYEGYTELVKEMWEVLFKGAQQVKLLHQMKAGAGQDTERYLASMKTVQDTRRDLPFETFLENPRTLTPHFLLMDSPITKHIRTVEALGQGKSPPA